MVVKSINSIVESSVNKDGTTELSLYYDRNVNHIYLDSNGGTYFDPVSQIYGQNIDLTSFVPERSGYVFRGWECIDRENGNVINTPSTMPNSDLYFRAKWDISTSSFTITYMVENADNDEYSNAGMYTVRNIETELNVSDIRNLEDIIDQGFETIKGDKKDYFEYNDTLSSSNFDIEVSGDSTTNINVYYDRKEYTLRFMAGRVQSSWWSDTYQIATATGGSESACSWTTVSSPATITKNGATYENDEYTITAKYEAYISDFWPTVSDVSNTRNGNTIRCRLAALNKDPFSYNFSKITAKEFSIVQTLCGVETLIPCKLINYKGTWFGHQFRNLQTSNLPTETFVAAG